MFKIICCMMLLLVVVCCGPVTAGMEIPNLEASVLYDLEKSELQTGFTSKVVSYKDLDFRLGYTNNKYWITALSYDLANIEKLGAHLNYAWGDAHLNLGFWCGYNFEEANLSYGMMSVMIQVNFQ